MDKITSSNNLSCYFLLLVSSNIFKYVGEENLKKCLLLEFKVITIVEFLQNSVRTFESTVFAVSIEQGRSSFFWAVGQQGGAPEQYRNVTSKEGVPCFYIGLIKPHTSSLHM